MRKYKTLRSPMSTRPNPDGTKPWEGTGRTLKDEEVQLIRAIQDSPRFFFEHVLGATLDEQQIQVVDAFPHHRRLAVKSGHSAGKDFLAARLALWFHITHYPSIVVLTGPTDRQVHHVVWGEIKSAYLNAKYPIGGELMETMIKSGDPDHYMIGFTAKDSTAFQGFHKENVFVMVTEAAGIEQRIWPGIESVMTATGKARMMAIGNATYDPDTEWYQMFTRNAALYKCLTLDSEKSSYCSKEWIEEMRIEHGVDSAFYLARVKGIFPEDVADTLIPLGWIERAQERWEA